MSSYTGTDTGLELVPDDFTKEEHQRMDAHLASSFNLAHLASSPTNRETLLYSIIRQLGRRAKPGCAAFPNLKLLCGEPALLGMLEQGVREGFQQVRRLKILRRGVYDVRVDAVPRISGASLKTILSFSHVIHVLSLPLDAVERAWDKPFRGNYAELMLSNINALGRSEYQANCISIIQSAGYGKSRMADEMAKHIFTIPINIRNPMAAGYPPSDTDVWEYLCTSDLSHPERAYVVVVSFFMSLFEQVAADVRRVFPGEERLPQEVFAQRWREHLLTKERVTTNKVFNEEDDLSHRSQLYERVVAGSKTQTPGEHDTLAGQLEYNILFLVATLDELCLYQPLKHPGPVKLMLYFDDADELYRDIGNGETIYDIVWLILEGFRNANVFTVFITNRSRVPRQVQTKSSSSSRWLHLVVHWGPITETAFDCHPSLPLQPGRYRLEQLAELEYMIRFGRPLFWTMLQDVDEEDRTRLLDDLMHLARRKLLCGDVVDAEPHTYSDMARLAVLDALITVDYGPRSASARQCEVDLVSDHMKTAFSIPSHRLYMHTGYPSEPFLAEAASRQMHHFLRAHSQYSMVQDFAEALDKGMIDLDRKDEMVVRLLLRKAYMDAIVEEQRDAANLNFSCGCNLVAFLTALFAQRFHPSVLNCEPDNLEPHANLDVVFRHAVVRFTHFVKAADGCVITTGEMAMAFLRGAAFIVPNGERGVHIAVPILLDRQDDVTEASMSALLIQVKQRHQPGSLDAHHVDEDALGLFPTRSAGQDARPYVTLLVEPGTNAPSSWLGNVAVGKKPAKPAFPDAHPRYTIRAHKCTDATWRVVRPDECGHYDRILSVDDVLGDHPRQDEGSLQLVRQQLPFWYAEPAWFSDEAPPTSDVAMEPVSKKMKI